MMHSTQQPYKTMLFRIFFLGLSVCTVFFYVAQPVFADGDTDDDNAVDPIMVRAPEPVIQIPGLELSPSTIVEPDPNAALADTYIESPFLSEYLAAVYRFGVAAAVLLCMLVIIVSGLQWTASGGNSATISSAKKRITGAITGMLLAVGSYSVLYTINPNLLAFPTLKTLYVRGINLEDLVIDEKRDQQQTLTNLPKTIDNNTFDELFKAFANCSVAGRDGMDWRFLKVVAYFESARWQYAQRANSFGFVGLFQVGTDFCPSMLKQYPQWAALCGPAIRNNPQGEEALKNPILNTAAGFVNLSTQLERAISYCGAKPDPFILSMLTYLGHNSGAGAQRDIIKASDTSCSSIEGLQQAIVKYWSGRKGAQGLSPEEHGKKRAASMTAVADLAKAIGITDIFNTSGNGNAACPLKAAPSDFPWKAPAGFSGSATGGSCPTPGPIQCQSRGKKIIAVGDSVTAPSQYVEKLAQACGHTVVANKAVVSAKTGPGYGGPLSLKEQFQEIVSDSHIQLSTVDDLIILGGANDIASGSAIRASNPQSPEENILAIAKQAKAQGLRVIVITMTPWQAYHNGGSWSAERKARLDTLNDWIRRKGPDGTGATSIDVVIDFNNKAKDGEAICPSLTRDGLHLNADGSGVMAELIASLAY
ncbi:MAG: hypothetical protein GW939_01005 [Candidatus Magasanikbacteria bacterium]|nr:hypothetical protein [Candidatus Magasanikbacteria bacterium]NCS71861.1 hypothetical protein [Candidatus Magasanikbacteria bacterium]